MLMVKVMSWLLVICTGFIFLVLQLGDGNWDSFTPAPCLQDPKGCFCERPRNSLMRQPSNCWSNLAFSVVGAVTFVQGFKVMATRKNHKGKLAMNERKSAEMELHDIVIVVYAFSNLVLGVGSGLFHATLTFWGQKLDNLGMYIVLICPGLYSWNSIVIARAGKHRSGTGTTRFSITQRFVAEYILVTFVAYQIAFSLGKATRPFFYPALCVGTLAMEMWARQVCPGRKLLGDVKHVRAAVVFFLISFFVWNLDKHHIVCEPDSLLQGHALWHCLDAVGTFYLFQYMLPIAQASYMLPPTPI